MERPTAHFFIMDFILLIVGIGLIIAVFDLQGTFFIIEFVLLVIFLLIAVTGMAHAFYNQRNGWIVIASCLVLIIIDIFFMFVISGMFKTSNLVALLFALLGLIVSFIGAIHAEDNGKASDNEGPYYPKEEQKDPTKEQIKDEVKKESAEMKQDLKEEIKGELKSESVKKIFIPGKYIASRKANKYHSPKCDWAIRIKKGNEVWFETKKEAEKQGFLPDECVN